MHDQARPILYARHRFFPTAHTPIFANRVVLDGDFEMHSHDFIELVLIAAGRGTHDTVHGRHSVRAGDVYILHPGSWHAYRDCRHLEVRNCCVGSELPLHELAWMRDDPVLQDLFSPGQPGLDRHGGPVARLPADLRAICRDLDVLHRLTALGRVEHRAALIGQLLLVLAHLAPHIAVGQGAGVQQAPRLMHDAVALLDHDLAHPWTLGQLAELASTDRSYLVRLFKAHTGLTPIAYLTHQRAARAATLLLQTARTVADIGQEVGWLDPNYFARRFRAHFGVSATAYRAAYLGSGAQADYTHRHAEHTHPDASGSQVPSHLDLDRAHRPVD